MGGVLQEPDLMQKICKATGKYESLAALRVQQSLVKTNDDEKLRGGPGRRANAVMMSDAVHFLEVAADYFGQVCAIR